MILATVFESDWTARPDPALTLLAVPADIEPPALARLLDFAERPRTQDWSLRAALVRYAQPRPQSVSDLLDLVRRLESALGQHAAILQGDGAALWEALEGGTSTGDEQHAQVVALLRVATELDQLGDVLAGWAVDIASERPDAQVDAVVEDVGTRLDALGVPHEERPPPRQRG
jgi:hypothetical protein